MGACISATKNLVEGHDEHQEAAPVAKTNGGPTFTTAEEVPQKHHHHPLRGFLHRITKEGSLEHLIRHGHHHKFEPAEHFGLNHCFETVSLAGRGGSGETYKCKDKAHKDKIVAVKLQQRPISHVLATMAYNEVVFQGTISEGCIFLTPIYDFLLTPTHVAMVLEYEGGGNMAEYIAEKVPSTPQTDLVLSEDEARYFFRQLVAGVSYMHSRNTAHRDMKLDNCLLSYDPTNSNGVVGTTTTANQVSGSVEKNTLTSHPLTSDDDVEKKTEHSHHEEPPSPSSSPALPVLKLADFQFVYSCAHTNAPRTSAILGTPVYMSPELLQTRFRRFEDGHNYDPLQADVWASAIWLLAVLIGAFPFDYEPGSDNETAEKQILRQQETMTWQESLFVKPYVRKMSPALIDLLDRMLDPDPQRRITMSGVKIHPWLRTPLQPEYEKKWRELENVQAEKKRQIAELDLDNTFFEERNEAVWQLVTEAEDVPREHHHRPHLFHHHHHRHHQQHREGSGSGRDGDSASSSNEKISEILQHDVKSRRFIDVDSIPDGCRIDMRLSALCREP